MVWRGFSRQNGAMSLAHSPFGSETESTDLASRLLSLSRDPASGKLSGLSHAIAGYYGVDPLVIRLFFVIAAFGSGVGILIYLAGWLLTKDTRTGAAPMDRLAPRWRRFSASTVVGSAISVVAIFGVGVSAALPFGWIPLAIVILAILTSRNGHYQATSINAKDASSASAGARRVNLPTVVILMASVLVGGGMYFYSSGHLIRSLAFALGTLGVGLLISSFQTNSFIVIGVGMVLTIVLLAIASAPATFDDRTMNENVRSNTGLQANVVHVDNIYALEGLTVTGGEHTFDLSLLQVESDRVWQLNAIDTSLTFILPAQADIDVRIARTSSSTGSEAPGLEQLNAPITVENQQLTIVVIAENSSVQVVRV